MPRTRTLQIVIALVLAVTRLGAQAPQAPAPGGDQQPVFRGSTRLVVQNVYVKDKDGKPIVGLTAKDFTVFEDNQRQEIAFVEFQRIATELAGDVPEPPAADAARDAAAGAGVQRAVNVEIAKPPAGSIKYQNRRLLVMYFDQSSMPLADQLRSYENARRFLDRQMAVSDLVAVMTFSNNILRVRQDFTDNRATLREVIDTLQIGDDFNGDGLPDSGDSGGDSEFSVFNTDRQLSALQTAVTMFRDLPEQKTLIYFGSGLRLNASDNQAQMSATKNAAIRANVTINPVDARGLMASAPLGDATRASSGSAGSLFGSTSPASSQASQDTLFSLAKDTGGTATFAANDLALGIVRAAQTVTD